MPDISMCENDKCEKRKNCYRFRAKPSSWQTYSDFEADNCEFFWSIEGYPSKMLSTEKPVKELPNEKD